VKHPRVPQHQILDPLRRPTPQHHRCLRRTRVRKVTCGFVGPRGVTNRQGEDLPKRQIPPRSGQFTQGAAEVGGEPRNGVHTPGSVPWWCHSVQDDERPAVSGGGYDKCGEVLIRDVRVARFADKFGTHRLSLHQGFAFFATWEQGPRDRLLGHGTSRVRPGIALPPNLWRRILSKARRHVQPADNFAFDGPVRKT
jgi:hypothetical protein